MSRVDVPESAPNAAPSGPAPGANPPRQPGRRLWRIVLGLVLGLLALLVVAGLGLWVWAGQDGSLATVLRLAGAQVPLVSENAQGSLRRGGTVDKLVWDKDGVRAEVEGATLLWQPLALLQGQLQIDTLSARRIAVRSEPKDEPAPPSSPPQSLSLPLGIEVKSIAADEFVWEGPPEVVARHFAGRYRYDRVQHALKLDRLEVMDGAYRGEAQVGVVGAPTLKVQLEGVVASPMPEGQAPLPLRASVDIQGPLDAFELALKVAADPSALAELPDEVRAKLAESTADAAAGAPGPAAAATKAASSAGSTRSASDTRQQPADAGPVDAEQPSLSATGTVTPWQAPFVSALDARFQALDVGAFLAQAPRTRLSGALTLAPLTADTPIEPATAGSAAASASAPRVGASAALGASQPASPASAPSDAAAGQHWRVRGQIDNALPGRLDENRLPVDSLRVDADWRDGLAVVRALQAELAGGTLQTQGQWRQPVAVDAATADQSVSSIQPLPSDNERKAGDTANNTAPPDLGQWSLHTQLSKLNPQAIHSQLDAFPLDGDITAEGNGAQVRFEGELKAREQRAATRQRSALQAIALRELTATGLWTGQRLELHALSVTAADAKLQGSGQFDPQRRGGAAKLDLSLPGVRLTANGDLYERTGQGQLNATVSDLARTQTWLARLPGMPAAVVDARAQGQADLALTWRGGWALPTVDAQLKAPTLTWQPPGDAQALGVRQLQLALQGGLDQAALSLSGQALQGERSAQLDLQAQGGRSTPQAPLAQANWRLQVSRLAVDLRDPTLGAGRWRAQLAQPVTGEWRAARGQQVAALTVASGELSLTSPEPARTARVLWDPVRWQPGQFSTAGRIVGLPMAWAEAVAGDAMRQAGVSGDVVFDGQWNAQLGQQLKLEASLTRTHGDLTVIRKDAATGIESRIAAGLREARLALRNDGERVNAQLRWDSAQLGTATGDLATRLAASRGADGQTQWTLPNTAPLDGQLKLQLPRVNAWSILAPPGWRLHGSVNADVKIAGTLGAPLVTGNLGADDLAMRSVVDGLEFGRGRLRARLAGQKLLLDEFSLRGAGDQGGRLLATGEAGLVDGAPQASLAIQLQRLRASIRADRQVTVSGRVDASLNGKLTRVTGQLGVDHALILLPEDSAPTLGSDVVVRGAKDIATRRRDEPLGNSNMATAAASESPAKPANTDLQVQADVKLNLGDDFRLRGMGIDTKLKGELTLAANGPLTAMPRLTGDVRTEGGTFKAYNQNLTIQRGLIRFSGAIDNPTLDIRALRPNYASEQRVGVQVQGTALLPVVTLYSNPSLSDTEALAWLLLGRAAPDTGAEAAMLQSAAMAVLGGKSGTSLASRFGLDELSFGSGNGSTSDASVTLGKRLSDNLYASYERSLSGVTGTLMIYLELSRRWTVRGQAGEDSAIDLLFRLSYD